MARQLAMHDAGMWTGVVDTEPGSVSGWHHHGEHETTLYVVSGRMRLESGPGGVEVVEGGPGDFIRVPAGAVHRESNPGGEPARAVMVRCGVGEPTINVRWPAQAGRGSWRLPGRPGHAPGDPTARVPARDPPTGVTSPRSGDRGRWCRRPVAPISSSTITPART